MLAKRLVVLALVSLTMARSAAAQEEQAQPLAKEDLNRGDAYGAQLALRGRANVVAGAFALDLIDVDAKKMYVPLALSGMRNNAGLFVGAAEVAIYQNRADHFLGVTQAALIANDAVRFRGALQIGAFANRSRDFLGIGQLGLAYNEAEEFLGLAQLGATNASRDYLGLVQVGLHNRTSRLERFEGADWSTATPRTTTLSQVGAFNKADGNVYTIAQVGGANVVGEGFDGLTQIGLWNSVEKQPFRGGFEIGLLNGAKDFEGLAQLGFSNLVGATWIDVFDGAPFDGPNGDFAGFLEVGVTNGVRHNFSGLTQVGLLGNAVGGRFSGLAQIGGFNLARERFAGGFQLGIVNYVEKTFQGASQLGVFNWSRKTEGTQIGLANHANHVRGMQVGLFNHAGELEGVQLGLVSLSDKGGLPVSVFMNVSM
jgi:hypothetical protein